MMSPSTLPSPRVGVLLSTYNGARYLKPQLDSLLAQDYPDVIIQVRDDGSSDSTLAILDSYAARYPAIRVMRGTNIGVARSFLTLLAEADPTCNYFAFCDQDDVWLPDKISVAVGNLTPAGHDTPTLYFSRVEYVDNVLRHLRMSPAPRRPGFGNALVENCAPGCTMLFNQATRQLILSRLPSSVFVHDSWTYLVVSAFGRLVFHDVARIKYRQHAANVFGAVTNPVSRVRQRLQRLRRGQPQEYLAQAQEFARLYSDSLSPAHRHTLQRFLQCRPRPLRRIVYALTMDTWRQSRWDSLILRVLILFGHY